MITMTIRVDDGAEGMTIGNVIEEGSTCTAREKLVAKVISIAVGLACRELSKRTGGNFGMACGGAPIAREIGEAITEAEG